MGVPDGMALVASPRLPLTGVGPDDPWRLLTGRVTNWGAVGSARSCYLEALDYTMERSQFGRPIAGFQAVQSYANYDVRTHHTNADFVERIEPDALKQAATVIAATLYHAAMREGAFPR